MVPPHRYRNLLGTALHYTILCMLALGGYLIWRTYQLSNFDQSPNFNMLASLSSAIREFNQHIERAVDGSVVAPTEIQSTLTDIETVLDFFLRLSENSLLRQNENFETQLHDFAILVGEVKVSAADGQITANLPELQTNVEALYAVGDELILEGLEILSVENLQWRNRSALFLIFMIILLTAGTAIYLFFVFVMRQQSSAIQAANQISDRANKQLTATINASMDAVIVADMDGKILECNTASKQIFGYDREEILGTVLSETIIPPRLRSAHKMGLKRYKETKKPKIAGMGAVALSAIRKDGSEFPIELHLVPGKAETGKDIMISYIRDMTETKTAEAALQQARDAALTADKAKSRFLAIMSHEMRTPLTGIFGALNLIQKSKLTKKQNQYLDLAQASGKMLLRHVTDVLDISRIDSGQLDLVQEPVDLRDLLSELEQTHTPIAQETGNRILSVYKNIANPVILGDSHRLRQIILNLMTNSLKFTEDGLVTLSVEEVETLNEKSRYRFQVEDTGIGIPVEHQPHIFEEFYTQDQSYSRANEGTGLGLAIVKRLVEIQEGTVGFVSAPGKGTTFWFELVLPHSQIDTAAEPPEAQSKKVSFTNRRILLVEDNTTSRLVMSALLRDMGLEVFEAENGAEAVTKAFGIHLDLILMDISMPVMDGIEATAKIKSTTGPNQDTPILALTAHALPQEQRAFLDAGMVDCLTKPVDTTTLCETLNIYLHMDTQNQTKTEKRHAAPTASDFNVEVMDSLRLTLGDDLFKKTLQTFTQETETAFATMKEKMLDEDLSQIQAEAHKTLGAAGLIGADALKTKLRTLEQAAKAGDRAAIPTAFDATKITWDAAKVFLSKSLDEITYTSGELK